MNVLLVEINDPKRIAELVTVSRALCDKPDILAIGGGDIAGSFARAYQTGQTISANLLSSLSELVLREKYDVILLGATALGSGLAGPLAVKLNASLITEVTGIDSDLTVLRPVYGGKALVKYKITGNPVIFTIRRNSFEKAELTGTTEAFPFEINSGPVDFIAEYEENMEGVPLEDAEIIVTGGRGIGEPGKFSLLKEMADILGGAVGASRGAVDEGWAPPTMQVGQTGKIVAPNVYFAVGVSGASQHLAGISNAKCVVAINKDEEANIFKRARFGIPCDYKNVVPLLIDALREVR